MLLLQAVRSGTWKLHFPHAYRTLAGKPGGTGGKPAPYSQAKTDLALFDLEADPGEPELVAEHPPMVRLVRAPGGADYEQIVREIHQNARREALGTDEAIERILRTLE